MAQNFSGALKIMDLDDFIAPSQVRPQQLALSHSAICQAAQRGRMGGQPRPLLSCRRNGWLTAACAQACIVPLAPSGGGGGASGTTPAADDDSGGGGVKLDVGTAVPMELPTERGAAPAIELEMEGVPKPKGGWSQTVTDEANAVKVTLSDCLACSGCVTSAETVLVRPPPIPAPLRDRYATVTRALTRAAPGCQMAEQSGDQFRTVLARMAAVAAGTPLPPPPEGAEEPPPPPRVAVVSLSPQSRA